MFLQYWQPDTSILDLLNQFFCQATRYYLQLKKSKQTMNILKFGNFEIINLNVATAMISLSFPHFNLILVIW